jgi:hypothetical protein
MTSSLLFAFAYASAFPSFSQWAAQYNRNYDSTELAAREFIYNNNVARIAAHNIAGHSWNMSVNAFADLTADEFRNQYVAGGYVGRQWLYSAGPRPVIQWWPGPVRNPNGS